jgi:hypothetical protein
LVLVFIALLLSLYLAKSDIHSLIRFPASQVRAPGAPTFIFPLGPRQLCGQPSDSFWFSLPFSSFLSDACSSTSFPIFQTK